jgi:hypothetical protein
MFEETEAGAVFTADDPFGENRAVMEMLQGLHGDGQGGAAGMVEKKQAVTELFEKRLIADELQAGVCQEIQIINPCSPAAGALLEGLLLHLLHLGSFDDYFLHRTAISAAEARRQPTTSCCWFSPGSDPNDPEIIKDLHGACKT